MNCHEVKERILESRATGAARRHLEACEDCASFAREVRTGGREVSEAFLTSAPSPGFEGRVGRRIAEREISVETRPRRFRAVPVALAAALVGAALFLLFLPPAEDRPEPLTPAPAEGAPVVVVTEPERENPLLVYAGREGAAADTELALSFAGDERSVGVRSGLDEELLRAWAMGARRAEVTVAAEVPGREIALLLEGLEKAGFTYHLFRQKHP